MIDDADQMSQAYLDKLCRVLEACDARRGTRRYVGVGDIVFFFASLDVGCRLSCLQQVLPAALLELASRRMPNPVCIIGE